jgi:hypothetical protein
MHPPTLRAKNYVREIYQAKPHEIAVCMTHFFDDTSSTVSETMSERSSNPHSIPDCHHAKPIKLVSHAVSQNSQSDCYGIQPTASICRQYVTHSGGSFPRSRTDLIKEAFSESSAALLCTLAVKIATKLRL